LGKVKLKIKFSKKKRFWRFLIVRSEKKGKSHQIWFKMGKDEPMATF
jgi:hypothetical protein